jgi:hypothetical protein
MEELLEAVFSVQSLQRIYNGEKLSLETATRGTVSEL